MSENKKKVGIWAVIGKIGSKLLSFLGKAFKLTKVGFAAASFAGYALLFSWKFALLLMIAVGFHESGHVWAMKRMGIKTKGFYFLPFIGGAAIAEEQYKTYGQNVFISIMGPVWGMLMAFGAACLYWATGNPLWAAAGAWMSTLNLFNLLPITPLDGGQMVRAMAFSIHKNIGVLFLAISMVACGYIMWALHVYLFVLILAVGALELFLEIRYRLKIAAYKRGELHKWQLPYDVLDTTKPEGIKQYPDALSKGQMALTVLSYLGTIAGLLAILFLLKHVSGADLAANFLE